MRVLAMMAVAGMVAGCVPLGLWHKAGVSTDRMQRDLTKCEVAALTKVPVNTQIRRTPRVYVPPRQICDAAGKNCRLLPARFKGGEAYTVDANKGLRDRVATQCMQDRGYSYVELPACSQGVADQVAPGQTRVLPRLGDTSCVVRSGDSWQIVTPVRR